MSPIRSQNMRVIGGLTPLVLPPPPPQWTLVHALPHLDPGCAHDPEVRSWPSQDQFEIETEYSE